MRPPKAGEFFLACCPHGEGYEDIRVVAGQVDTTDDGRPIYRVRDEHGVAWDIFAGHGTEEDEDPDWAGCNAGRCCDDVEPGDERPTRRELEAAGQLNLLATPTDSAVSTEDDTA